MMPTPAQPNGNFSWLISACHPTMAFQTISLVPSDSQLRLSARNPPALTLYVEFPYHRFRNGPTLNGELIDKKHLGRTVACSHQSMLFLRKWNSANVVGSIPKELEMWELDQKSPRKIATVYLSTKHTTIRTQWKQDSHSIQPVTPYVTVRICCVCKQQFSLVNVELSSCSLG